MPTIDLFNKSTDEAKLITAAREGTLKIRSKLYAKYITKCVAEGAVIGTVLGLATVGALVIVAGALTPSTEETE